MREEESAAEAAARRAAAEAAGPQLPKVSITAKPEQLKQAFSAAERLGKIEGKKAAQEVAQASSTTEASGTDVLG
jgi:hypothetical protein